MVLRRTQEGSDDTHSLRVETGHLVDEVLGGEFVLCQTPYTLYLGSKVKVDGEVTCVKCRRKIKPNINPKTGKEQP